MKPLSDRLGSLSLTTLTLIVLLLWLTWGILLTNSEAFYRGFDAMNRTLLREWLTSETGSIMLKGWFVGLCGVMVLLAVNLVFCTWKRFFNLLKVHFTAAKLLMLVVHILFGLVALVHFAGFMVGFRHEDVRLTQGQSFQANAGYEIRVENINFSDDLRVLVRSSRNLTPMDFNPEHNSARISLHHDGQAVGEGQIRIFEPFRHEHLQVTLKRFAPSREKGALNREPDVVFTLSGIPTLTPFLLLYPLMILGMTIHLAITWKRNSGKPHEET
jgi:hypothetical protein